jgi:hypothetical protein
MIYLKNRAGLCATLALSPVVSVHAMDIMRDHLSSGNGSSDLRQLVDLLNDLPVERELCMAEDELAAGPKNFLNTDLSANGWVHCTVAGVYLPEVFKSNADTKKDHALTPTPEGFGWPGVDEIAQLAKKTAKELSALGVSLATKSLASIARALKKQSDWTIVEVTPASMLSSDACAVYLVDQNGFVNDKGNPVPLGGARLFESSAAAQRTIQSRGWQNAVVVRAHIHVEGLAMDQKNMPNDLGSLGAAIAHKEAEHLRSATVAVEPAAPRRTRL